MANRLEVLTAALIGKQRRDHRKQREAPPPSRWARSSSGRPFRMIKTTRVNSADEWLYRLDFGNIKGNQLWGVSDLTLAGVVWLSDQQPVDWVLPAWRRSGEDAEEDAEEKTVEPPPTFDDGPALGSEPSHE